MSRLTVILAAAAFAGLVLVLPAVPWFGRRRLTERLRPYAPGASGGVNITKNGRFENHGAIS